MTDDKLTDEQAANILKGIAHGRYGPSLMLREDEWRTLRKMARRLVTLEERVVELAKAPKCSE